MNLNLSTSDRLQCITQGVLSSTVGSSIIVLALLTVPANTVEAQHRSPSSPIVPCETSDTQQSSAVKAGLLHENVSTLISAAASAAVGSAGLKRLESFLQLQPGWDGMTSKPIDLNSIADFSSFFDETGCRPSRLGVFMSAEGNVVVNWPDQHDQLVELEFHSSGVDYFIERSGEEGTIPREDIGFRELLNRIAERVEV